MIGRRYEQKVHKRNINDPSIYKNRNAIETMLRYHFLPNPKSLNIYMIMQRIISSDFKTQKLDYP